MREKERKREREKERKIERESAPSYCRVWGFDGRGVNTKQLKRLAAPPKAPELKIGILSKNFMPVTRLEIPGE